LYVADGEGVGVGDDDGDGVGVDPGPGTTIGALLVPPLEPQAERAALHRRMPIVMDLI
jgi:hypothetical protein